jgi:hypothetical protein
MREFLLQHLMNIAKCGLAAGLITEVEGGKDKAVE